MKDVAIKLIKSKVCSCVVSVNRKEYEVNSVYSILEKVYDEMYDSKKTFDDLILEYIKESKDIKFIEKIKNQIETK